VTYGYPEGLHCKTEQTDAKMEDGERIRGLYTHVRMKTADRGIRRRTADGNGAMDDER
jgi:hypothetical protein